MITSYGAMQNAILARNIATSQMVQNSSQMLSAVSFGNSQPLRPSFAQADCFELQNKANETKISVLNKLIEALEKKLAGDIKRSTPKYGGVDYQA